ncbi:MAG: lycopene beta-cyclase [Janthinobacterium sp.]|jgi:lycopene beta-cyclase
MRCRAANEHMSAEFDLIILGGGCAGLSLALRLAALGERCPRTLIIEARHVYVNDRTWCFWGEPAAPLRHLVQQRWNALTLHTDAGQIRVDCSAMPYKRISADAFYSEALAMVASNRAITLLLGEPVDCAPRKTDQAWHVTCRQRTYRAALVIDTRAGVAPRSGGATLWQSFYGQEIVCSTPLFDPACVTLMDFRGTDLERILFTYVLPLSTHRALIEVTQFGPLPLMPKQLTAELALAVAACTGDTTFEVLRYEHGMLPMGLPASAAKSAARSDPTYVRAGILQGAARPATGYAFQRIQRWAEHCANRLAEGSLPVAHAADPPLLRALDGLFLSLLRAQPGIAPALFLRLFECVDSACLTRFLSEQGSLADCAKIVAALPARPFLRHLPVALREIMTRHPATSKA